MRKCLCLLVVFAEPIFHACGIHTGLESLAPLAQTYLSNVTED